MDMPEGVPLDPILKTGKAATSVAAFFLIPEA
jgi:hypothetical protein